MGEGYDAKSLADWLVRYLEQKSYRVLVLGHTDEFDAEVELPFLLREVSILRRAINSSGDIE